MNPNPLRNIHTPHHTPHPDPKSVQRGLCGVRRPGGRGILETASPNGRGSLTPAAGDQWEETRAPPAAAPAAVSAEPALELPEADDWEDLDV